MLFGLSPLYALAIRFFASMVLGMVPRITLDHPSGSLMLDNFTWLFSIDFQATAM